MIIKTYGYDDKVTEVVIPDDKEISGICVCVLSGDETGIICFTDGTTIGFDACPSLRMHSFYDGMYYVTSKDIQRWINFDVSEYEGRISYARQEAFDE